MSGLCAPRNPRGESRGKEADSSLCRARHPGGRRSNRCGQTRAQKLPARAISKGAAVASSERTLLPMLPFKRTRMRAARSVRTTRPLLEPSGGRTRLSSHTLRGARSKRNWSHRRPHEEDGTSFQEARESRAQVRKANRDSGARPSIRAPRKSGSPPSGARASRQCPGASCGVGCRVHILRGSYRIPPLDARSRKKPAQLRGFWHSG